jgi:hypothetical protein
LLLGAGFLTWIKVRARARARAGAGAGVLVSGWDSGWDSARGKVRAVIRTILTPTLTLSLIKHDFDRLERALLSAADKSERDREMDSIERRRAGGGGGGVMSLSDGHASSVSMEATSSRVAARSVGRA